MEDYMIHTQESWDMVQEGLISQQEGLDILYSTAFPRPVQIVRQSIPHNGQTLYAEYAGYANRRFGDRWFGPPKAGGIEKIP